METFDKIIILISESIHDFDTKYYHSSHKESINKFIIDTVLFFTCKDNIDEAYELLIADEDIKSNFIKMVRIKFNSSNIPTLYNDRRIINLPVVLAIMTTLGFFTVLMYSIIFGINKGSSEALLILLGSLTTAWTSIIGYYFGSSIGSPSKSTTKRND
jgi:hypothetical protein